MVDLYPGLSMHEETGLFCRYPFNNG